MALILFLTISILILNYNLINDIFLIIYNSIIIVFFILFFAPTGKKTKAIDGHCNQRVDERDVIFAREEYTPDSEQYAEYYSMKPENKEIDDKIRKLPELFMPGGRYYRSDMASEIRGMFRKIELLTTKVDGKVNTLVEECDTKLISEQLIGEIKKMGAKSVGIAELNPMYVYSHVGRGPEQWGASIMNNHKYVIVFTLEMDYFHVEKAPLMDITIESARQYLNGAEISISIANYIRKLGYPARAHIAGSNYQIMLPPVASDAGLGELGRIGYLITNNYGARVRLGAITTDLPLLTDKPISIGIKEFCEKCMKCAVNCPSGAIPKSKIIDIRGVEKWQLNIERCVRFWRIAGSDCGICMKVCPFSHPPTFVHNMVRKAIKRSSFARYISIKGDDIFYGRKVKIKNIEK
ncbi:MAG: reductive dehalogenase [candidate division Zixibacteria bacterium]|nr:reductive dehalogenase [candidate division Zixibacteria bacterium]